MAQPLVMAYENKSETPPVSKEGGYAKCLWCDVIALATGPTHSISRDEFDLKGRISFAPLSAAYGRLRAGANPRRII
jgi:hypothetical protein